MSELNPETMNKIYLRYRRDSPFATHFRGFKSQLSQDVFDANGRNSNLKLDLKKLLNSSHQDFFMTSMEFANTWMVKQAF